MQLCILHLNIFQTEIQLGSANVNASVKVQSEMKCVRIYCTCTIN